MKVDGGQFFMVGKAAKKDEEGSYVWKLRDELAEALGRVDLSKVNLYANLEPNFWKISHGNDCISDVEATAFEKRQVIVVHKDTAAKGKSKVSQGEDFMATMKKGDLSICAVETAYGFWDVLIRMK